MPLYGSNWRLTLATYAGIAFLACVVWWFIAVDSHKSPEASRRAEGGLLASFKVFPALLRIRAVRIVLAMSLGVFLFGHGLRNWLPEILRMGGMSAKQAGFWAAAPSAIGLVGTLLVPRLATPSRRIPILFTVLCGVSVSAAVIATTTGLPLITGLLLSGLANAGITPILMLTLMDSPEIGSERMGAAGGLYFTAGEVGGVSGPILIGVLSDLTGNFRAGLFMLTGSSAVLALLALCLGAVIRRGRAQTFSRA
jgi:cyanate permease